MKVYFLNNCSTCQRILSELSEHEFEKQDIKSQPLRPHQLDKMAKLSGSYQGLFSRRAMKYRQLGLNQKELNEEDFRNWILKEYTFLKRPVFLIDNEIFIGSSKKEVERLKQKLSTL